jgi:hypothetical protein
VEKTIVGVSSHTKTAVLVLLSLAYVITRFGCLGRELGYEEGAFLGPGISLFHSGHYGLYWGEMNPDFSPFHKPPLTSLMLGLFSLLSFDPVAGARLVPFLIGWAVCLAPYILTGSWVPSLLVLASPFLYGASSQMQTDPTGVILGYTILCLGIARLIQGTAKGGWALAAGLVILWLTKFEAALLATACLAALFPLVPRAERGKWTRVVAGASVAGILLLCGVSALLAMTTSRSPVAAWAEIFVTTTRIVSGTVGSQMQASDGGMSNRLALFHFTLNFRVPQLLLCCWLPWTLGLLLIPSARREWRFFAAMAVCFVIPLAATFAVAYVGDGYPRYFLIVIPPSLFALGAVLAHFSHRTARLGATAAILAFALLSMAPDTLRAMQSAGSPNAFRGEHGTRLAADIARSFTKPGDLILAPELELPYLAGRRVLNIESFELYPAKHQTALGYAPQLRAAIVRRDSPPSPILDRLLAGLEVRGAKSTSADSFSVYVLTGVAVPECSQQQPVIYSVSVRPGAAAGSVPWELEGGCWDPASVKVEFRGKGCEGGCILPASAITRRTTSRLEGAADLPAGNFQVRVSGREDRWSDPSGLTIPAR